MKRTNIVLDENKLSAAKKAFDLNTAKEVVDLALTELLKMHRRKGILNLKGRVKLDLNLGKTREIG